MNSSWVNDAGLLSALPTTAAAQRQRPAAGDHSSVQLSKYLVLVNASGRQHSNSVPVAAMGEDSTVAIAPPGQTATYYHHRHHYPDPLS